MSDANVRRCVTHHHACDCREAARKQLEHELAETVDDNSRLAEMALEFREQRDELRAGLLTVISAANAILERWETPLWKDAKPTATFIHALRDAVDKVNGVMP